MKFVDEVVIEIKSGDGGDGALSFHRAAFIPKGGPDGGDGGRGGDVIFITDRQLNSLEDFQLSRKYHAENGKPGRGSNKSGKSGSDLILKVPNGTLVFDVDNDELLADLSEDSDISIVAEGGRGGRGNMNFATPKNRAPRRFERGKPGEHKTLRLELKLIADVGLVGKPNAGKSTLLAALTSARPKIAGYPFSTLSPNLGIIETDDFRKIIIADIPGLAKGAAEGKGLGHRFLRHIERTKLLVILIEVSEDDYAQALDDLLKELHTYSESIIDIPRLVVMSKMDLLEEEVTIEDFEFDHKISALQGEGLEELKGIIIRKLSSLKG